MPILLRSFFGESNTPDLVKRRCLYQFYEHIGTTLSFGHDSLRRVLYLQLPGAISATPLLDLCFL